MSSKHEPNPLYVRDCYQQVKTIHRLTLTLQDDVGDLSLSHPEYDSMADEVTALEGRLMKLRDKLEKLSAAK